MYNTYSLFEQMYGNFYRYLVVTIICSFCPKRYMEITVDVFGREFNCISLIARSRNWDNTWKSLYTWDLKGCQVFKQTISIICYTRNDFSDVIKLSTILKCGDAYAIIISLLLLNKTSTNSDVKALEVNWIKLIPVNLQTQSMPRFPIQPLQKMRT